MIELKHALRTLVLGDELSEKDAFSLTDKGDAHRRVSPLVWPICPACLGEKCMFIGPWRDTEREIYLGSCEYCHGTGKDFHVGYVFLRPRGPFRTNR